MRRLHRPGRLRGPRHRTAVTARPDDGTRRRTCGHGRTASRASRSSTRWSPIARWSASPGAGTGTATTGARSAAPWPTSTTTPRRKETTRYETLFGIARDVALLEDTLFELLPPAENRLWPEQFVRGIAPGVDVGDIVTRWIIWLLNDEASPVHKHVTRASAKQIHGALRAPAARRRADPRRLADDAPQSARRARRTARHQRDRVAVREGRVEPLGRRHQDAVPRECTECGATLLGTGPPADLRRGAGRPVTSPLRWRLRSPRC